jgi:hypothetical protein
VKLREPADPSRGWRGIVREPGAARRMAIGTATTSTRPGSRIVADELPDFLVV